MCVTNRLAYVYLSVFKKGEVIHTTSSCLLYMPPLSPFFFTLVSLCISVCTLSNATCKPIVCGRYEAFSAQISLVYDYSNLFEAAGLHLLSLLVQP